MARRLARWTLRAIKTVLAVVALAALVAWPWSYGHPGAVICRRWTPSPDQVDLRGAMGWYDDGRFGLQLGDARFANEALDAGRANAAADAPGWNWLFESSLPAIRGVVTTSAWGPFRWDFLETQGRGSSTRLRVVTFPCYLLALLAGAWPLASAAAFARRRRRRASLRRRPNLCRRCGYDLRATPSADGATLATCPECGTAHARERQ